MNRKNSDISLLYDSIINNKYADVLKVLENGIDPNIRYDARTTLLHDACKTSNIKIVKLLLQYGARPDERDHNMRTALHFSVVSKDSRMVEITRLLVDNGASINIVDRYGIAPIHLSVKSINTIRYLLYHGADVNVKDNNNNTPLNNAIRSRSNRVAMLLMNIKGINILEKYEETPLICAVKNNNFKIARKLLSINIDPNIPDDTGSTALHFAVRYGTKIVKLLIYHGAIVDVNSTKYGYPLDIAISLGKLNVVKILLENGANISLKPYLHIAVYYNLIDIVNVLILYDYPLDSVDDYGNTALYNAVNKGRFKITKLLIHHGADVNARTTYSQTPLYCAVGNNNIKIIKLLLDSGANPNIIERYGLNYTVLCKAVYNNNILVVKSLLEYGANPNIGSGNNFPLYISSSLNRADIMMLLLKYGANPDVSNTIGETVLYKVINENKIDMVNILIENGANPNIQNRLDGNNPLHIACYRGNIYIIGLLIKNNANVSVRNYSGFTPLHISINSMRVHCCTYLLKNGAKTCDNSNSDHRCSLGYGINIYEVSRLLIRHTKEIVCRRCVDDIRKCNDNKIFRYALSNEHIVRSFEHHIIKPLENSDIPICDLVTDNNRFLVMLIFYLVLFKKYISYIKNIRKSENDISIRHIGFSRIYDNYDNSIYKYMSINDFKNACIDETEYMNDIKIGTYTLFDIYTTNRVSTRILSKYIVDIDDICNKFPIYGPDIRPILEDARNERKSISDFTNIVDESLESHYHWNILPREIKYKILNYISIEDMRHTISKND
ncbi:ankyrin repeat family protein [Turkeypox virus]|uniref:Ankyrin repeat family protein n=1 Tax=Turkeypox virus TaxID=336486 RepID=A0A0M3ZPM8_9POXV|nr:ankyrin repeat family protein [Turkeypox virus]ALA62477.1 ankyrin repeat family protein [Turkeypox virus]